MALGLIFVIIIVWVLLSATILVSLCMVSSRYNNRNDIYERQRVKERVYQEPKTKPASSW